MLKKRIIPCLDIKNGRTVKGINFQNLHDAGDPVTLAQKYAEQGADELVLLDITATGEKRKTVTELTRAIARGINIPFTVGGGIGSLEDTAQILKAGADKISINSAALARPALIDEIAREFGNQFLVVAIDALKTPQGYQVYSHGGKKTMPQELLPWAEEAESRGAGEILLTAMNTDGTCQGYDIAATSTLSKKLKIPLIASGGAGLPEHFAEVFTKGKAQAALAASLFHYNQLPVPKLKAFLKQQKIPVRC